MEGTWVPHDYGKLVAMRKQDGSLATAAYMLSQAELLTARAEESVFGEYKTFQVSVSELEPRTRVNLASSVSPRLIGAPPTGERRRSARQDRATAARANDPLGLWR
jgi:DNA/RNA endonuclease G (NUC1)